MIFSARCASSTPGGSGPVPRKSPAIEREDGDDVFVHYSAIQMNGYRTLEEGQRVEFDLGPGKKGEEAQNVRVT
jgi:CspA family cold shock protein